MAAFGENGGRNLTTLPSPHGAVKTILGMYVLAQRKVKQVLAEQMDPRDASCCTRTRRHNASRATMKVYVRGGNLTTTPKTP